MANLKAITADLQTDVTGTYDQTKTTIKGFVQAQTVLGVPVLAPPLTKWIDVFTDTTSEVALIQYFTPNGRLFLMTGITAGLARIICYSFNSQTGAAVYIGKIVVNAPNVAATTHTLRSLKVDDTSSSAIKIFFMTTGTVAVNGGLFLVNNVNITDFVQVSVPTIPFANGSNQKAVYFLQENVSTGTGANQLNTASAGSILDRANSKIYVHNGVSATHQYYVHTYSGTPNVPQTTVTITIASPGVVSFTAHGFNNNDQVVLTTTGALPTGLTAGTTYFVRNSAANTFELSATSGGASINTSGAQSGVHSLGRAFGITGSLFTFKTGNLPALTGTLIILGSEKFVNPSHTTNAGSDCAFIPTTSNLYLGKLSELSSGVTLWPSLVTSNILGTTNQIVAPTLQLAMWDEANDRAIYSTNTTKFVAKKVVNNLIEDIFGVQNNLYMEGLAPSSVFTNIGTIAVADIASSDGWFFLLGSSTGQRGVLALNIGSSYRSIGTVSRLITKVLNLNKVLSFAGCAISTHLPTVSSHARIFYRTSGYGSEAGGWTQLPDNFLMNGVTASDTIQFKFEYDPFDQYNNNPFLSIEFYLAYYSSNTVSDNLAGNVKHTISTSPAKSAFEIIKTYDTSVPKLYFRAYDSSNVLVASANTVDDSAFFEYSSNDGTSWIPLGTIPNVVGTNIRYNWVSPPGVEVTVSLSEA